MQAYLHLWNRAIRATVVSLFAALAFSLRAQSPGQVAIDHAGITSKSKTADASHKIDFTTNLTTEPELKQEIDRIMDSVRLEE